MAWEKLQSVREMQNRSNGFLEDSVCRKCYLPRLTTNEVGKVRDREFKLANYTNRTQIIGK